MNDQGYIKKFHRRSIRLKDYDYSTEGSYFLTIVTHKRECLFGQIKNGLIKLNDFGEIVSEEWNKSTNIRKEMLFEQDEFVIMPNHIHGIVHIVDAEVPVRAYGHTPLPVPVLHSPSKTIGSFVRGFKAAVTTRINTIRKTPGQPVWLRNYYEHIIVNEKEYEIIANYIFYNPENWGINDEYFSL